MLAAKLKGSWERYSNMFCSEQYSILLYINIFFVKRLRKRRRKKCHIKNYFCALKQFFFCWLLLKWVYLDVTIKVCWWFAWKLHITFQEQFIIRLFKILFFAHKMLEHFYLKTRKIKNNKSCAIVVVFKDVSLNLTFFTKKRNRNFCSSVDGEGSEHNILIHIYLFHA